jgi:hypothetical protein
LAVEFTCVSDDYTTLIGPIFVRQVAVEPHASEVATNIGTFIVDAASTASRVLAPHLAWLVEEWQGINLAA